MAERANPSLPVFQRRRSLVFRGLRPQWEYHNPYAEAAIWRFEWVASKSRAKDVLDIPCGMGWGTSFLKDAKSVVGIDISRSAIQEASARYGHMCRFLTGSMAVLPFGSNSFDVISCLEGIEHIPVEMGEAFIDEAFRVLRPDGKLLISSPHCLTKAHSGNPYHIHEYQPEEISNLISRKFTILKVIERDVDELRVLYIEATPRRGLTHPILTYLRYITHDTGQSPSQLEGDSTLYGTVYRWSAEMYLGQTINTLPIHHFLKSCQEKGSGLLIGPELSNFKADVGVLHDEAHLRLHSTISALPFYQELRVPLNPIREAHRFCDLEHLKEWCEARNWKNAWFEGNNILFVGQLLVYLRDFEKHPDAQQALDQWFSWLEGEIDPATSLWGTNGYCDTAEAVYGGYHQLLVYWHEDHPIQNPQGLVDAVLSLRHYDGGFNPGGNAGACEDVDSVDILVNCYKRWNYRRPEIRVALWLCVDHILATQNPDGGFPYNRNKPQSHMGIPGTEADPNVSCTFPTWFRIHTLALCHEIIPEHPQLTGIPFRFNSYLSMGWHKSPPGWKLEVTEAQHTEEQKIKREWLRIKRINQIRERVEPFITCLVYTKNQARVKAGAIKRRLKG